jgi:O-antigen biosynthesis protein WbqP
MIRFFDIFFSIIGLIIFFPLILIIIFLSFIDTRSPFFYQKRVGINKKIFLLIKFRTMKLGTPSVGSHLVDKSFVTPFGYFLRVTKIDELPQLLNVINGNMSLVGPRPCLASQRKLILERNKRGIYRVLPGITGLAQLKGINMSTPILLAKTDYSMIKKMSLINYFYYIFITLSLILKFKFFKKKN